MPSHVIPMLELHSLSPQELVNKYGLEMLKETKQYYMQPDYVPTAVSAGVPTEDQNILPDSTGESIFNTTKVQGDEFQLSDIPTAIGNVPASVEGLIRGFGDLIHNAPEIGQAFVDRPLETAQQFGEAVIEPFTSKEKFRQSLVENPADILSNFIPGAGQLAKIKSLPKLIRSTAKLGSPTELISSISKRAGRGVDEAGELGAGGLQISTGLTEEAIKAPFEAGLSQGRTGRQAVRVGQRRRLTDTTAGREFADALEKEVGTKLEDIDVINLVSDALTRGSEESVTRLTKATAGSAIRDVSSISVITNIEKKMNDIMSGFPGIGFRMIPEKRLAPEQGTRLIGRFTGDAAEQVIGADELRFIEDILNKEVFTPMLQGGNRRLTKVTASAVTAARKRLDNKFDDLSTRGQAIVTQLKKDLNELTDVMLPEGDPFPAARRLYSDDQTFLAQARRALGAKKGNSEQETLALLRSINSIFNASNAAPKLAMVSRLEDITGLKLKALLAGRAMSPVIPKGLVGRGAFIGALTAGAAFGGGVAPVTLALALPGMAIFSPRIVGNVLASMGALTKPIKDTATFFKWLKNQPGIRQIVDEGGNIAAVTARVMDQEASKPEQPQFFKPLRGQ